MSEKPYTIKQEESLIFSFTSVGPKGRIEKLVRYDKMSSSLFNLTFGDRIGNSYDIDDESRSNNGDMIKVLSTVIETIDFFFEKHSGFSLQFQGSTESRTKLYIRIFKNHRYKYLDKYIFWGFMNGDLEKFEENKPYTFLVISKK